MYMSRLILYVGTMCCIVVCAVQVNCDGTVHDDDMCDGAV